MPTKNLPTPRILPLLLVAFVTGLPAHAGYRGGTGTADDPYVIVTPADLMLLGNSPEDYDKHFILTADIDLDPNLPRRKVFDKAVIAPDWTTPFTGVFDGGGHAISNFVCRAAGQREAGLFGTVDDPNAEIKNLGLINPNVQQAKGVFSAGSLAGFFCAGTLRNCYVTGGTVAGYEAVGALVGYNRGYLIGCYSAGNATGELVVGGLVGGNRGRIVNCHSIGTAVGRRDVGGLVGYNANLITDCYSAGAVVGDENVGGLLGRTMGTGRSGGSAEYNCFWDLETSGQTHSAGGTGLTTAQMRDPNTFMAVGWDFVGFSDGPHDVWAEPLEGAGYPVLYWQLPADFALPKFSGGTGEPNDPYLISSPEEWNRIGHNPRLMGAHFKLMNDIDLAKAESFVIGNEYYPFTGVFEGSGHTVAGFRYGPAQHNYVGLFGYVNGRNARIAALGVIDAGIDVEWGYGIGLLVGCLDEGVISGCFARGGSITGGGIHVGGLVGRNYSVISGCYADRVNISGRAYVGGLVGLAYSPATVVDCYSSSVVSGDMFLGGLVAHGPSEHVVASFWDVQSSGQATSAGGGTGRATAQMQMTRTFLAAGWDFVDEAGNGTEDLWWILEGQDYPRLWWEATTE